MIRFCVTLPQGLHQQPDRAPIIASITRALGACPAKRFYRTHFEVRGTWERNGKPTSRDVSNVVSVIFDCLATAAGFGVKGKGDGWLQNRGYSVSVVPSPVEQVIVTLMPV